MRIVRRKAANHENEDTSSSQVVFFERAHDLSLTIAVSGAGPKMSDMRIKRRPGVHSTALVGFHRSIRRSLVLGNGYSMCRAVARAMASPQYSATTNNAMSIPAEIPAEVMTFPAFTTWDFESTVTFGKSSCIVCRVRQWVVARRPSSNPAFPRINAPATDPGPATGMQSRVSLHSLIGPRHPAKIAKTKNTGRLPTNSTIEPIARVTNSCRCRQRNGCGRHI